MSAEAFSYTLTLGGRYAGTQDWVLRPDKGTLVARVQTDFGGALPATRRIQESRIQPRSGFSLAYAEAEGSSRKPHFETIFDERTGMVTLRQGKDEATEPMLEDHHDPLSLLLWLRRAPAPDTLADTDALPDTAVLPDTDPAPAGEHAAPRMTTVRMVGGRVHLQPLPASEVGGTEAQVYFLRPGGAYVYVEQAAPHRLLRLIQPSDFGPVQATLTHQEAAQPSPQSSGNQASGPSLRTPRAQVGKAQTGKPRRRGK